MKTAKTYHVHPLPSGTWVPSGETTMVYATAAEAVDAVAGLNGRTVANQIYWTVTPCTTAGCVLCGRGRERRAYWASLTRKSQQERRRVRALYATLKVA